MARITSRGAVLEDGPILVTGAAGFAGRHLMDELRMGEGDAACDRGDDFHAPRGVRRFAWDLPDGAPPGPGGFRYVVHLAGITSVSISGGDPGLVHSVNVEGLERVLDHVGASSPEARVLVVSSSEVYGSSPSPLSEESPVAPSGPYGRSKLEAELVAGAHAGRGMDIVIARPFPHFGPWQAPHFALPSFCRRILEARHRGEGYLAVGNLEPVRDYSLVEDVAAAYALLLSGGETGGVYNVAGGEGRSMAQILGLLLEISGANLEARVDPSLVRSTDVTVQVGDAGRLIDLGWRRNHTLEEGLQALFRWWEERE